jgi:hypothetical protein
MAAEEFVLRWNNHQQNFAAVVEDLWRHDTFTDVILCSEGRVFPAHRVILSACSPYFLEILSKVPEHQHPVVFLQGVPLKDLHSLLTFMYSGEVVVSAGCDMASFFRTAENLQIKGNFLLHIYLSLSCCFISQSSKFIDTSQYFSQFNIFTWDCLINYSKLVYYFLVISPDLTIHWFYEILL